MTVAQQRQVGTSKRMKLDPVKEVGISIVNTVDIDHNRSIDRMEAAVFMSKFTVTTGIEYHWTRLFRS